jgi:hypothetical protein
MTRNRNISVSLTSDTGEGQVCSGIDGNICWPPVLAVITDAKYNIKMLHGVKSLLIWDAMFCLLPDVNGKLIDSPVCPVT